MRVSTRLPVTAKPSIIPKRVLAVVIARLPPRLLSMARFKAIEKIRDKKTGVFLL